MSEILIAASAGGHWEQAVRLLPAFGDRSVAFLTTSGALKTEVHGARLYVARDANLSDKLGLVVQGIQVGWAILRERPSLTISTGAAPGFFAVLFTRLLGGKTIWIDSLANQERLSVSGRYASRIVHLCLTQWPNLESAQSGVRYWGKVI